MHNKYKIDAKYWEIVDRIIYEYKKSDNYLCNNMQTERIASNWLSERLDKTAPVDSLGAQSFYITENEMYGLISIVETVEGEDAENLLHYLRNQIE